MDTPIVNGGVKCKRWSGNNFHTLFCSICHLFKRSVTQLFWYPIGQSHYCKCWLWQIYHVHFSFILNATQSLAKDTHYSEHRIPQPDISRISQINLTRNKICNLLLKCCFSPVPSISAPGVIDPPATRAKNLQLSLAPHSSFPSKPTLTAVHWNSKINVNSELKHSLCARYAYDAQRTILTHSIFITLWWDDSSYYLLFIPKKVA